MKKQILHQKFSYAEINPYKNYSNIITKNNKKNIVEVDDWEYFDEKVNDSNFFDFNSWEDFDENEDVMVKKNNISKVSVSLKSKSKFKRKNTKYFYSKENSIDRISVEHYFKNQLPYVTNKDRHIKRHYGRPFTSITIHKFERVIDMNDDKITVSLNHFKKSRYFNCKFFNKKIEKVGFTINLKNGNIYTFTTKSKFNSRIRTNSFNTITEILLGSLPFFETKILNLINIPEEKSKYLDNFQNEFKINMNDKEFLFSLYNVLNTIPDVKLQSLPISYKNNEYRLWIYKSIVDIFVTLNKIKVPNKYHNLIVKWYPTKVYLKRNDNKLVSAILDRLNIKSKQTIKLIHENPNMSISRLFSYVRYFGYDDFHKFISKLNPNLITLPLKNPSLFSSTECYNSKAFTYNLTNDERNNILKLFNDFFENHKRLLTEPSSFDYMLSTHLRDVDDHIRMLKIIKKYDDTISFKSRTLIEFNVEHIEFSRMERKFQKEFHTYFVFDNKLLKTIETPILINDETYYPIILKTDEEFILEGQHMHHCVGGYVENGDSIIVSIRHNSKDNYERITCQYNIVNQNCVQSKYFCNNKPPEHFNEPLLILNEKILNYDDSIKPLKKIKTPNKNFVLISS